MVENSKKVAWIVGLTGAIGSGKSTVAEIFKTQGANIIDADILAREVVAPNLPAVSEIGEHFGDSLINSDGTINRKKLAEIIFKDESKRRKLEEILHPKIFKLFQSRLKYISKISTEQPVVIYVVPLLRDSVRKRNKIDETIFIDANKDVCIERIVQRDKINRKEAKKRFEVQIKETLNVNSADYVIENNTDISTLEKQVKETYLRILQNREKR